MFEGKKNLLRVSWKGNNEESPLHFRSLNKQCLWELHRGSQHWFAGRWWDMSSGLGSKTHLGFPAAFNSGIGWSFLSTRMCTELKGKNRERRLSLKALGRAVYSKTGKRADVCCGDWAEWDIQLDVCLSFFVCCSASVPWKAGERQHLGSGTLVFLLECLCSLWW